MKTITKIIGILVILLVLFLAIYLLWLNINDKTVNEIEKMENQGSRYVSKINKLVSTNLSWRVKRKAMYAIDKIRDESSIPVLMNQIYFKGHWWQYWWDYQDVYEAEAFQEEVMYVLVNYGDSIFKYLIRDLEKRGPRKVSDNILYAMGLLRMEEATDKLRDIKKNPKWTLKHKIIEKALRLTEKEKDKSDQTVLLNKDKINEAIGELNQAIEGEIDPIQEVHLALVIEDLGTLKVEASRDTLKKIIQKKSEILKIRAIRALGKIGNQGDGKFLLAYINHEDIDIRRETIIALGLIGSEYAIADLEEVLKSKYEAPRNKFLAKEALKQIRQK